MDENIWLKYYGCEYPTIIGREIWTDKELESFARWLKEHGDPC